MCFGKQYDQNRLQFRTDGLEPRWVHRKSTNIDSIVTQHTEQEREATVLPKLSGKEPIPLKLFMSLKGGVKQSHLVMKKKKFFFKVEITFSVKLSLSKSLSLRKEMGERKMLKQLYLEGYHSSQECWR